MQNNHSNSAENNQEPLDKSLSNQSEHLKKTSKFISDTSLDDMIEIAEIARRKKLTEPPKWVIPDEI